MSPTHSTDALISSNWKSLKQLKIGEVKIINEKCLICQDHTCKVERWDEVLYLVSCVNNNVKGDSESKSKIIYLSSN